MFKKKRKVRLHLKDGPSIEGLLVRRQPVYVLWAPKVISDAGGHPDEVLGHVEVPVENVAFYQVLAQ